MNDSGTNQRPPRSRSTRWRKAVPVVLMFVVVIALVLLATWAAGSGR